MVGEFGDMARVEDEVKKTRQKSAGRFMWMGKSSQDPFHTRAPRGPRGARRALYRGFEDIPFV